MHLAAIVYPTGSFTLLTTRYSMVSTYPLLALPHHNNHWCPIRLFRFLSLFVLPMFFPCSSHVLPMIFHSLIGRTWVEKCNDKAVSYCAGLRRRDDGHSPQREMLLGGYGRQEDVRHLCFFTRLSGCCPIVVFIGHRKRTEV